METIFKDQKLLTVTQGTVIKDQTRIFFLVNGYVGLFMTHKKQRKLLFVIRSGDIFPYPLFSPVTAKLNKTEFEFLTDATVRILPKAEFEVRIFSSHHHMMTLVQRFQQIYSLLLQRISELNERNVKVRLIYRLVYYAERFGKEERGKIRITVPFTHQNLAMSLGTTRETVNRFMRALEKDGLIIYETGLIIIPDLDKLEALLP